MVAGVPRFAAEVGAEWCLMLLPEGDDERRVERACGRGEGQSPDDALSRRTWTTDCKRGSVLPLLGTSLRDASCWSPPNAGAGPSSPHSSIYAGAVILLPRPACSGITAERVVAVTGGRPSPCCTPLNSCCCNLPITRPGSPIPARVVARPSDEGERSQPPFKSLHKSSRQQPTTTRTT